MPRFPHIAREQLSRIPKGIATVTSISKTYQKSGLRLLKTAQQVEEEDELLGLEAAYENYQSEEEYIKHIVRNKVLEKIKREIADNI